MRAEDNFQNSSNVNGHEIIISAHWIERSVLLNLLLMQDIMAYYGHNSSTRNDNVFDSWNPEWLEMKFQAHFIESKQRLSTF